MKSLIFLLIALFSLSSFSQVQRTPVLEKNWMNNVKVSFDSNESNPTFYKVKILPENRLERIEFQDGDDRVLRARPGNARVTDWAIYGDDLSPSGKALNQWFDQVMRSGDYLRRTATIILGGEGTRKETRLIVLGSIPFYKEYIGPSKFILHLWAEELYYWPNR